MKLTVSPKHIFVSLTVGYILISIVPMNHLQPSLRRNHSYGLLIKTDTKESTNSEGHPGECHPHKLVI